LRFGGNGANGAVYANAVNVNNNLTTAYASSNHLRIEFYISGEQSLANLGWKVLLDQNLTGKFSIIASGTNLTFNANNFWLTLGSQNCSSIQFAENPQIVTTALFSGPTPTTQTVSAGSSASFWGFAYGWSPAYQWLRNGSLIANATNLTYTLPVATSANNNDQYSVVVSNQLNSANVVTSSVAILSVTGPASAALMTNNFSGSGVGGTLSLSWPPQGWRLQTQTNSASSGLSTNWYYLTDGTITSTNIGIDVTKKTVFYRLTYP